MTDTPRHDQPIEVVFGNQTITAAPLRGLIRIRAFEEALVEEVNSLAARVQGHAREAMAGGKISAEALMESGVDQARLLKLGLPDVITDELIDESTAHERLGLLTELCFLNGLGRWSLFLGPEMMLDLAANLNRMAPDFPIPESKVNSSLPDSPGPTSNAN